MLIRFSVTRRDTGAPIPNVRIELSKGETVGFTDAAGKVQITTYVTGFQTAKVSKEGYRTQIWELPITSDADQVVIPQLESNAISPPPTPGPKEEIIARIGTSCSIINNYTFAKSAYQVRHDRNGNLTSLHMDLPEIRDIANRTPACFEVPPPPPKTIGEVADEVTTLQKLLNNTVGRIENLTQGIGDIAGKIETEAADRLKGLMDLETRIKAWITTETADRLKGLLDMEARLKSWISDTILEILLMKLMEGRKYDSRR